MKAFVGHSFEDEDAETVDKIIKFFVSAGVKCETGEKAENKSVAEKIKKRILNNDIFVGIFTRDKRVCLGKESSETRESYTTSNWVLQESGFAVARERELIFLVENGIYKFPELQGNLELIYFDRKSLDDAFRKVIEMIQSMKSKKTEGISSQIQEGIEDLEEQETERQREEIAEGINDKEQKPFLKLAHAIFEEKNYTKAQRVYSQEVQKILSDAKKPEWEARVQRYCHGLGDAGAFDRLVKLAQKNKNNPGVIWELAMRYKEMREYQKAKDKFLETEQLCDINEENHKENIIMCYVEASLCLSSDGKFPDAIELLSRPLSQNEFKEFKAKVLAALASVAKMSKDAERVFVYAEGSLNLNPSDTGLRFDLAYQYGQENHKRMSLLHYKKLTDTMESPAGLNNLGIAYDNLKLPAKSIESYSKAAALKETLAMANMAQRYLNEGFADDAGREIKRANELSRDGVEVHGNIGYAKNKLDEILENEGSKEKEVLLEAEEERKFRVKYSEAFYSDTNVVKEKLGGIWETPWGDLELVFDEKENSFRLDGKSKEKVERFESLLGHTAEPKKEHFKTKLISIKGKVEKLSGRYEIGIEETFEYDGYISPTNTKVKVYEASGYMVISKDYNEIVVMEQAKEEKLNICSWKRRKA